MSSRARERRCRDAVCYVNANLLVALDRRDRRAIEFAGRNRGCLYTVAEVIEDEVPGAAEIARRHGILVRTVSRGLMAEFSVIAVRLLGALQARYTLSDNDLKDIDHIAMTVATGARAFVTSEPKLCRWIEEYRDITGTLQCIDWREGECSGLTGRDKEGEARVHEEDRSPRVSKGEARSRKGGRPRETGGRGHREVLRKGANAQRSRKKAERTRKEVRGRKRRKVRLRGLLDSLLDAIVG